MDSPNAGHETAKVSLSTFIYMAKSKSFFGLRRGSTKTLTFSVYNGQQVTKDRIADVKNPRSSLQMKQRAIMATAMHAYSALNEICDHSFEGLTYGQKSMNYFVSENARMVRSSAPNVNLSLFKGNSVSNAYVISKGSLPSIFVRRAAEMGYIVPMNLGANFTFGQLMAAMGATEIGDMVTIVNLCDNVGGNASIYWIRLKLTEDNSKISFTASQTPKILASLTEGKDFETNIDNFSVDDYNLSYISVEQDTGLYMYTETDTNQSLGVILSRKTDTGWLRSTSTMVNMNSKYNYAEALATYPESGLKILNGGNV